MERDDTRADRQHVKRRAVEALKRIGWTIDPRTSCMLWNGATDGSYGYGRIQVGTQHVDVHRLSLELTLGRPIEPGLWAIHSCDRPLCCNPVHLREGTPKANAQDRLERTGNHGATLTHCSRGHEYTPGNTAVVVESDGRTRRRCRTCRGEYRRARRARA